MIDLGRIVVFNVDIYTLQFAPDMNTKTLKVRQRWYNTWGGRKTFL